MATCEFVPVGWANACGMATAGKTFNNQQVCDVHFKMLVDKFVESNKDAKKEILGQDALAWARQELNVESLTVRDFVHMASTEKVELIEQLSAVLLRTGFEFAVASAEYYNEKFGAGTKSADFPQITYQYHLLEAKVDTLKHVISALQSTLRAEGQF